MPKRTAGTVEAIKTEALSLLENSDLTLKQETFNDGVVSHQ
jgi:hypothetical protein